MITLAEIEISLAEIEITVAEMKLMLMVFWCLDRV
jgi:hypothetical protein